MVSDIYIIAERRVRKRGWKTSMNVAMANACFRALLCCQTSDSLPDNRSTDADTFQFSVREDRGDELFPSPFSPRTLLHNDCDCRAAASIS